mmetsp:Transcript_38769/g.45111  ORF Transcript_38769/g.45111 Transcript_38769/m.45111 type:complete len:203 (-) Transcript_38769:2-610(-)
MTVGDGPSADAVTSYGHMAQSLLSGSLSPPPPLPSSQRGNMARIATQKSFREEHKMESHRIALEHELLTLEETERLLRCRLDLQCMQTLDSWFPCMTLTNELVDVVRKEHTTFDHFLERCGLEREEHLRRSECYQLAAHGMAQFHSVRLETPKYNVYACSSADHVAAPIPPGGAVDLAQFIFADLVSQGHVRDVDAILSVLF